MRLARAHKYGAKRCEMDGYKFASQAEMRRYQELKLMLAAGAIRNLKLQPRYPLYAIGPCYDDPIEVAHYVADFSYQERCPDGTWAEVTEDVKGMKTSLYRLKAKLFAACYGREIRETS